MRYFVVALMAMCLAGCGTLKVQNQVLTPQEATATEKASENQLGEVKVTPIAQNVSPITYPTSQSCNLKFFWGSVPGLCPDAAPIQVQAAFQVYDNGYMLWEQATGSVFVLYNGGPGQRIEERTLENWPEAQPQSVPPPNHVYPIRGFSRAWQHEESIRNQIGWPLGLEQAYTAQFQMAKVSSSSQYFYISIPNGQVVEFNSAGAWRVVK